MTATSNAMFPSSLQNMETRYFSSPVVFKTFREIMYKRGIKFLDKHNIIGGSLGSN